MRPKFVIGLLLVAGLVLVACLFLKQQLLTQNRVEPTVPATPIAETPPVARANTVSLTPVTPAPVTASSLSPEQEQAAISAETDRLFQWSMNDDAESLSRILADLNHPEKEVRLAAIEATKQFGSREAIPALKAAVANTQDTEEQMELLAAADFLSLPTIAENDIPLQKPLGQIQPAAPKRNLTHQHDPK